MLLRKTKGMKKRSVLIAVATALLMFLPSTASAAVRIDDSHVIDEVGVLDAETKAQLETVTTTSVDFPFYMVITKDWDGSSPTSWCSRLGDDNPSLPASAVVYAIATELGEYNICLGPAAPVDSSRANSAAAAGSSNLRGGITPENLTAALSDTSRLLSTSENGSSGTSDDGYDSDFADRVLLIIVFIGFIGFVLIVVAAQRNAKKHLRQTSKHRAERLEDRIKKLNVSMMQTDDAVRAAREDLAFAQAQFGELETTEFAQALDEASSIMTKAFKKQPEMESETNPDEQTKLVDSLEQDLARVNTILDAQAKRFGELRDVESNIDSNISSIDQRISEAHERVGHAQLEIKSLRLTYSDQVLQSILDNPDEANRLLDAASQALAEAKASKDSDRKTSVFHVNLALRALTQALSQINEVMSAEANLNDAKNKLAQAIGSISSDLEDVQRLAHNQASFGPLVEDAHRAIEHGNAARRGGADPLSALTELHEAEDALDNALLPLRNAEEKQNRTNARLDRRFAEVDAAIVRADSHVSAHPFSASSQARTLIARAKAKRAEAAKVAPSSPMEALDLLADSLVLANRALDSSSGPTPPSGSGGSNGGIDLTSLILGGLLFGNGSNNNYGSSSRGGFGSGGSSSFGGGFSSGGFGGFSGGFSSGGSGKF
ncbi:hypothetical protein HMPREF9238_01417 [Gleimia europaea ACS-120-V-Col10b]|uniref:TPM domain-containing protein n=2 Tax=Gleimia TaxID=2692113 RepID=A0A9W5VX73_9ACTO|nr:hypothetical protein HMPREF9238_01417 [Gleimia europaea ACS-120-V-Col10b]